jgi:argininosuccinate lyase
MSQSDSTQYTWAGRFSEPTSDLVKRYTASVDFDQRMWRQDIRASLAHATMLAKQGIIAADDLADIERGMAQVVARSKPAPSSGRSTSKTYT